MWHLPRSSTGHRRSGLRQPECEFPAECDRVLPGRYDVVDQPRLRLAVLDRGVDCAAVVRVARRGGLQGVAEGVRPEVERFLRRLLIREDVMAVRVDRPLEVLLGEKVEVGLEVRFLTGLDRAILVVRRGFLREELLGCLRAVSKGFEYAVQRIVAAAEPSGRVEPVTVVAADGPAGREAVRVVLVELGDVLRDGGKERRIVVPVTEQTAQDLVIRRVCSTCRVPTRSPGCPACGTPRPTTRADAAGRP